MSTKHNKFLGRHTISRRRAIERRYGYRKTANFYVFDTGKRSWYVSKTKNGPFWNMVSIKSTPVCDIISKEAN